MILRHSAMLSWTLWLTVTSTFWRLTGQQLAGTSALSFITSVLSKSEVLLKSRTSPSTTRSELTCKTCKNYLSLRIPTMINWKSIWETLWAAWMTILRLLSERSSIKSTKDTTHRSSRRWLTSSPWRRGNSKKRTWQLCLSPRWKRGLKRSVLKISGIWWSLWLKIRRGLSFNNTRMSGLR